MSDEDKKLDVILNSISKKDVDKLFLKEKNLGAHIHYNNKTKVLN